MVCSFSMTSILRPMSVFCSVNCMVPSCLYPHLQSRIFFPGFGRRMLLHFGQNMF